MNSVALQAADGAAAAVRAPAKVNLALHVTGRRADGYHGLDTLVVFTEFSDRLTIEPADTDHFSVSGPFAAPLGAGSANLVTQARDLLRREAGALDAPPVRIKLEKNIPVASGVGGGSSDAAATLLSLDRLWSLGLGMDGLSRIGLALGADVPMCLRAAPLLAQGLGEAIAPVLSLPALHLVLVNPGVPVETRHVFAALTRRDNAPLPALPPAAGFAALIAWLGSTRNDLQAAAVALVPEIDVALKLLEHSGAAFARMSGSGATCFGLFADAQAAKRAEEAIRKAHAGWFAVATTSGGSEG